MLREHVEYDDYCSDDDTCTHCKQTSIATEFVEKLVQHLYGPQPLNVEELDDCIREICDKHDVDVPRHGMLPVIQRNGRDYLAGL